LHEMHDGIACLFIHLTIFISSEITIIYSNTALVGLGSISVS
jgi:hypothetical protein